MTLAIAGCDDFLSKEPDNRASLDAPEKISELLVTAYPEAGYSLFCEVMSDNVEDNPSGIQDPLNADPYFWREGTTTSQDSPENYWNGCYTAIASANHALEYIEKSGTPELFTAQRGEALVARAYSHFMLVTLFAPTYTGTGSDNVSPGVPYVTEPEKVAFKNYDRGTVKSVYEQIEKDLVEGLPLIDDKLYVTNGSATGVPKYHFTTAAAHAFASRFYLFKKDYDKVLEHSNAVFTSDVTNYLRPWNTTYASYSANDLAIAYTNSATPSNLLLCETLSSWARSFYVYRYATGANKFLTMMQRNPTWAEYQYEYSARYTNAGVYFLNKYREHFVQTGVNSNTGYPYTIVPLFTAEEVLFNRAEARIMKGNYTEALNDMNIWISTRVVNYNGMDGVWMDKLAETYPDKKNSRDVALAGLLDMKRVEFLHEGMRWFDILRHNIEVNHNVIGGKAEVLKGNDLRRVLQIPREAVATAGLAPNPR